MSSVKASCIQQTSPLHKTLDVGCLAILMLVTPRGPCLSNTKSVGDALNLWRSQGTGYHFWKAVYMYILYGPWGNCQWSSDIGVGAETFVIENEQSTSKISSSFLWGLFQKWTIDLSLNSVRCTWNVFTAKLLTREKCILEGCDFSITHHGGRRRRLSG